MHGYRKLIVALVIVGVAAVVDLNEHQAYVLAVVATAMLASNAAVHIGRSINETISRRHSRRGAGPAGVPDDGTQATNEDGGTHRERGGSH